MQEHRHNFKILQINSFTQIFVDYLTIIINLLVLLIH